MDRPLQFTYICEVDLSQHRGGTGHVVGVIRQLTELGHQVRLIVPAWREGLPPILDGVEIVRIPTGRIRVVNWVLFHALSSLYLAAILISKQVDVIYSREMVYNFLLPVIAWLSRRPFVVEVNSLVIDEQAMIQSSPMRTRLTRWSQALTFHAANRIIAVTRGIGEQLVAAYRLPPGRVVTVPNGTDPALFIPQAMGDARAAIHMPTEIPLIGFVGSCYPYHDVRTLIAAAPAILAAQPAAQFLIVGDGYMRQLWTDEVEQSGLSSHFLFTGRIAYTLVSTYMNACTVCVAPFTRERNEKIGLSPMKLYDYLACGRPVVGSAIEGVGDLLAVSGGGLAVTPEDPQAFGEAILTLLNEPERREAMGRQGRAYVLTHHTWAQTAEQVVACCRSAMTERKS